MLHPSLRHRGPTKTKQHQEDLLNKGTGFSPEVARIIKTVFAEQKAVYGISDNDRLLTNRFELLTDPWISAKFYAYDSYVSPDILSGGKGGRRTEQRDFEKIITDRSASSTRNKLFFLTGPVGVGKTAFLRYLTSKRGSDWFENSAVWFIRINADNFEKKGRLIRSELMAAIVYKIARISAMKLAEIIPRNLANLIALCSTTPPNFLL